MLHRKANVTALIRAARDGDVRALDKVRPLLYEELRRIANKQVLFTHRPLQPVDVVRELFLKLRTTEGMESADRLQFSVAAGQTMRWILRDMANDIKGRGTPIQVSFDDGDTFTLTDATHLANSFQELEGKDADEGQVAELKLLVGLSLREMATAMDLSQATVDADWAEAGPWMRNALGKDKAAA